MRRSVVTLALVLAVSGCSAGSAKTGRPAPSAPATSTAAATLSPASLHAALPPEVQQAGRITVCSDPSLPPVDFYAVGTQTFAGIDSDVAAALAKELGVELAFGAVPFDASEAALRAGSCQIVMSGMPDTQERRQSGVDFVDYLNVGTVILVARRNPAHVVAPGDLCGRTIAVRDSTQQAEVARQQAAACQAAGKPATVLFFDTDSAALDQLRRQGVVAVLDGLPQAAYAARTSGGGRDFEIAGTQIQPAPFGIAVPAQNKQLTTALADALRKLAATGAYGRILARWGVQAAGLPAFPVNAGT